MDKISVIIITKDEEKNITKCLQSVSWADEIIVVDSESADRTVEMSKKITDKVFTKRWEGYVRQKNYALSLVKNEWVLNIDADERASSELQTEIMTLDPEEANGFLIRRQNFLFGREITTCGWNRDYQMRLFKKSKTELPEKLVHEGFVVKGTTGKLKNVIVHHTYSSLYKYLKKVNNYTSLRAEELYKSKKKVTALTLLSHPISAFFRYFVSLKGYKDGMQGLIISFVNSVSTLLTYVKIWEKQKS